MRSRGWSGNPPASDADAIDRILDVVDAILDEGTAPVRIVDVASALGVTRPTVYRYFPSTETLLLGAAMRSANGFLDQLAEHISDLTDPAAAVVEGIAFAVESLGSNQQIRKLLTGAPDSGDAVSLTSDTPRAFGQSMLQRLGVDWQAHGFNETALNTLAEIGLRVVHSLLVDPGEPRRTGPELRRFIAQWIGPTLVYPRIARAVTTVEPLIAHHRPDLDPLNFVVVQGR
ncbi:transcriptional regulator [Mycolicibacterium fortuitum]|uniref:Transcriptional regulator n=1 Tax=Mycolicibacterium fortuitum TaxID=1766 RepID=A0A378UCV8_MYCFO|nr:transcriptional regulator [Mycolicibacterium fortuitum]